jgi:general secretion pathway protein A
LEQIRLLTNLETNDYKLLQIVMLGQPELREILKQPQLLQLSQRITSRYHLGPLTKDEVPAYVNYRLSVAGLVRSKLFPPRTLKRLFQISKGVPRLINVICDRALLGAYVQGKEEVDIKTLKTAACEISGEESKEKTKKRIYYEIFAGLSLIVFLLVMIRMLDYEGKKVVSLVVPQLSSQSTQERHFVQEEKIVIKKISLKKPANYTVDNIKEMAFQALFNQWNISYKGGDVCEQAKRQGLRCLNAKGGINIRSFHQINRPVVLRLANEKRGEYYATLTSLKGDRAVLTLGNETGTADLDEIARRWTGEYLLLWRAPIEYKGKLNPGDSGPLVQWLDKKLAAANGRAEPIEPQQVYNGEIVKEVMKLQLTAGLTPDGIVGFRTIMYLNAATGNGEPLLNKAEGNK